MDYPAGIRFELFKKIKTGKFTCEKEGLKPMLGGLRGEKTPIFHAC
jgi:hypothetical protein